MSGNQQEVIVVGAGLGGLSAAIHLALSGQRVRVLEKTDMPGGKAGLIEHEGFFFDTGPSLLTMPFVLEAIFKRAGRRVEDYLDLVRLQPACRYFFLMGPGLKLRGHAKACAKQYAPNSLRILPGLSVLCATANGSGR